MECIKFVMPVIFVDNIAVSKEFYQYVFSLEIENDFGENVVFANSFSIWQKKRAEEIIFGSKRESPMSEMRVKNVELYFETGKIEEIWKKIKTKSIKVIHGPKEEVWGQRTLRFYDPDTISLKLPNQWSISLYD
jgi:predicted enzyme related to lactoylglutathione lyase